MKPSADYRHVGSTHHQHAIAPTGLYRRLRVVPITEKADGI